MRAHATAPAAPTEMKGREQQCNFKLGGYRVILVQKAKQNKRLYRKLMKINSEHFEYGLSEYALYLRVTVDAANNGHFCKVFPRSCLTKSIIDKANL